MLIPAREGESVMELIRGAQIDDLLALCGCCCFCATYRVYADAGQLGLLTHMDESEDALLQSCLNRQPNSRLSCQSAFKEEFAGLNVTIAPEE